VTESTALTPAAERVAVIGLISAFVAGYLWIAGTHGALGASRNDDWSYLRVAFDFWRTGHVTLTGFVQMSFIGQTALAGAIFAVAGPGIASAQIGVAVIGGASVFASFLLLRSFLTFGWSVVACVVLLSGPLFGSLSVSFMTDVPSCAAQMLTLFLGWRAVARDRVSIGWLVAAAAAGVYATSIREFGSLAFGAVLIVAVARAVAGRDRQRLIAIVATGTIMAAIVTAGLVWRHSLPHDMTPHVAFHPRIALRAHAAGALSLALFVSPCVLALSPRRTLLTAWRLSRMWSAVTLGLSLGALRLAHARFLGNYFTIEGSYPETTVRATLHIVPPLVFLTARIIAAYALTMLAFVAFIAMRRGLTYVRAATGAAGGRGAAGRGLLAITSAAPVVTVFVVALAVAQMAAVGIASAPLFDRYFVPFVPLVGGLTLAVAIREGLLARGWSRGVMGAGLVALAIVGALVVDASAAVDGSKWALSTRAQSLGYAPGSVDGGFEWFGFHQVESVTGRRVEPHHTWWTGWFPPRPVCATVSIETADGSTAVAPVLATTTSTTLFGQRLVFVLRPGPDACAVPIVR
jgi:hypothetical protein